jgi:D-arabinose 1-dehydrogenase
MPFLSHYRLSVRQDSKIPTSVNMSLGLPTVSGSLEGISPLILGGAVFNTQYNDNPEKIPITDLLEEAFKLGINAIDTSPYYGPSEVLLGHALNQLIEGGKIKRDQCYICTKVGRLQLDDFDYTPEWIEKSVKRSIERFQTTYLDVVFLHDIEFKTLDDSIAALRMLMHLKSQGLIKWVGISGYPVDYLYQVAKKVKSIPEIGPLDLVMNYSNMCLQNTTLESYYDKFITETGVRMVNNASILSMSLLRYQETRSFHPAGARLKQKCEVLAIMLENDYDTDLADLATRFALKKWADKKGRTVLGVSNIAELHAAWNQYRDVTAHAEDERSEKLFKISQRFLGEHLNETWSSGIEH